MFGIHFPFLSGEPPLLTIEKVNLKPIILISSQELTVLLVLLFFVNLISSELTNLF